ncbi:PAS domain S-box protein [Phosphitispora sp. TUW77]|uniref:PAS domain S-box protein n=1 Tax=Phosphitispora sp. TUW77 TaxID=3152361 RepID=UPI003AB280C0
MKAGLLSRFLPQQITRRIYFGAIILTLIPAIFIAFAVPASTLRVTKSEKEKQLYKIVGLLNAAIGNSYSDILKEKGVVGKSSQVQVKILHDVLQPIIDETVKEYPEIGMGYYSLELDSVLAANPPVKSIAWNGQDVIWYSYPVYDNGNVVGHIWSYTNKETIYASAFKTALFVLIIWFLFVVVLIFASNKIFGGYNLRLHMLEERFSLVFNASPAAICLIRWADGIYTNINTSFEKITGHSKHEVIGKSVEELGLKINYEYWSKAEELIERFGYFKGFHAKIHTKTQEIRDIVASYQLVGICGEKYLLGFFEDISEIKKIEKNINELLEIIKNGRDAIFRVSSNGTILNWNNGAEEIYGYSSGEVIGKHVSILATEDQYEIVKTINKKLLEDEVVKPYNATGCRKDGSIVDVSLSVTPVRDSQGTIKAFSLIARDISEQIKLQREMARLEGLNLIGQMAASISHEIRNPMTTVKGFLQLLQGRVDSNIAEYFELMIEELNRANSIIGEFLSLARNKATKMKQQNMNNIIDAIFPLLEADAIKREKKLSFEKGQISELAANEREIRQLMLNLVRNGMEATPQGGRVTIKTYMDEGNVVFAVHDQGNGIKPEFTDKIGTPFFTTKEEGTGLGLPVCYSIAERHNAWINFDTGPKGTTFFVYFKAVESNID